ncbi:DUF4238 domain-containing protein [Nocardioides sp. SOB44]|uniref:DUF4238 domain-containing protein n=1 Tax=Nocardioides cremeus TaxID=3058044 RepID=A0ABT8TVT5_9ACTN|nr:DUF4238 domain-containing protein [Nocardioides cremeus]MDO3398074.1 DUF4238 domain-containing protein [Nocardioides cremeus]
MSQIIRPVKRQHTVTERLLKGFAGVDGRLAVFDRAYKQRRMHPPGAGIFVTEFDRWDSHGAEERWNEFENDLPVALARVAQGTALHHHDTVETLRAIVAVHWLRSRSMMRAREQALDRFLGRYRRAAPDTRAEFLAEAYRRRTGLIASTRSELEWTLDEIIKEVLGEDLDRWHSERDVEYLKIARGRLDQMPIRIHSATGADLVIGDSPVAITIDGRAGAGPHQNVGIEEADQIAMPIAPDTLITFGATNLASMLSDEDVAYYNELQWGTFEVWIAARPGGTGDQRLRSEAAVSRQNR